MLALWGLFGQSANEVTAREDGVTMTVSSPEVVRGGLYFQATVEITTSVAIDLPRLVLADGWIEGMQVNSIEPAAESETSRDGTLVLSYGAIEPGDRLKVWFQFQVDPTQPGRRSHRVELDDGTKPLVTRRSRPHGAAVMDLVLRTVFVFALILLVTRAVGRRELSSMEPFDLILLVVIGDMVQQGVTQSDYSLTGTTIVVATLGVLVVATAYLSYRFKRLRPLLEGEPTLLISDGRLLERNLQRERMTVEEVRAEARQQSIGSLDDIAYAVLETNGKISFITK